MTVVVQRILRGSVTADGKPAGRASAGLLLLIGVREGDSEQDALVLAAKIARLRIFVDENGKMNRSVQDIGGEILAVSNFSLCADASHGNRPSFTAAMAPDRAKALYERFCEALREEGVPVETGVFGASMTIDPILDGPITILLTAEKGKIL